jgi:hypothetical protein
MCYKRKTIDVGGMQTHQWPTLLISRGNTLITDFQSPLAHFLVETLLTWVLIVGKMGKSRH